MKTKIIILTILFLLGLGFLNNTYLNNTGTTNSILSKKLTEKKNLLETWKKRIHNIKENGVLPIIDTQATYESEVDINFMIKSMDKLGVSLIAFAPKFLDPEKGSEESIRIHTLYPQYFVPTIADGTTEYWSRQKGKFIEKIENEARSGDYSFMGEFELRHYMSSRNFLANYTSRNISIFPESLWVHRIFKISSEEQLTFQIHNDPENDLLGSLEKMLAQYPNAQVIWTHLGQIRYPEKQTMYTPEYVDTLLKEYSNLHFDLAVSAPGKAYPENGFIQNTLQKISGELVFEWKELLEKHPDRFTIGTDIAGNRYTNYPEKIGNARTILLQLSQSTGEKIAYKNAWRLITGLEWDKN